MREFYVPIAIGVGTVLLIFSLVIFYEIWTRRKELKPIYGRQWWWRLRLPWLW